MAPIMKQTKEQAKERAKERAKEYYLKNKEKKLEYVREYYLKNKEQKLEYFREYYLKNKEKIKEYNSRLENRIRKRARLKNRYQTDINYRLLTLCRGRLRHALKGEIKSAATMKLISCTIDELRTHIESQFEPWMTWENQGLGGWDVDHIKACSHFDMSDPQQQRECFHWSNLQPLEHIANIKKGAR